MTDPHDDLYAAPLEQVADFTFDADVARVFPDMIRRSVPGYGTIVAMIGRLAERLAQPGSRCYDLGCSLGAAALALRHGIQVPDCAVVAVDNAPAMIDRARAVIAADDRPEVPLELHCADIRQFPLADASVVVLNFTLQFIPLAERETLLARIYAALRPGGALVLSEKIRFPDPTLDRLFIDLHHNFKRAQGYSDLEISQKRSALEHVLVPEPLDDHRARLERLGFAPVDVWFQCFNFSSLVALKPAASAGGDTV